MKRFWIILTVAVLGLVALFIFTKPDENNGGNANFEGNARELQADDHVRNARDKKVTLIEYGDFQCPSCGSYYPILKQLEEKYREHVSFAFRHFPIINIHPNAFAASRAAEAAGKQGKFFEMHDKLFETQNSWGQVATNQQSLFESYAEELGLNMEQFKADYISQAVADRINRDVSSAKQFNISGTPTFILNGEKIENPGDVAAFEKVLNDAITKAGGTPPQGEASAAQE